MASTLGQFTAVPLLPQAYTSGPVTALRVQNGSPYRLRVLLGGQMWDMCDAGADQTYALANAAGYGGWVILIPGRAPLPNTSQNAPFGTLNGVVTVTSYGGGDTIPYGTATQNAEALYSPIPDTILDSMAGGLTFRARAFGARGDGVTDDTAVLQALLNCCGIAGAGEVRIPAGTFISQPLTMFSFVHIRGAGISATTLKLKSGSNGDLLSGGSANTALISIQAALGSGNAGGLVNWGLYDLSLDGNKAGQSSGTSYPLRCYGYGYILQNLRIKNGYSGGLLLDWNGGAGAGNDSMEAEITNVKVHDCNSIGVLFAGPHDSQLTNIMSYNNASHGFYFPIHAQGVLAVMCHAYNNGTGAGFCSYLIEGPSCQLVNCIGEGPCVAQVVLLANSVLLSGCNLFGFAPNPSSAVWIGQPAGQTAFDQSQYQSGGLTTSQGAAGCFIDGISNNCQAAKGVVYFGNDAGHNLVRLQIFSGSGTFSTGTVANTTTILSNTSGIDSGRNALFTPGGQLMLTDNGSVPTLGNGGTIATTGNSMSRVTTSGAVTGAILQAGNWQGQTCTVVNESANSITFAASATSHVADGVSDVIAGTTARTFVWDTGTSLWYRVA